MLRSIISDLIHSIDNRQPVAFTALVETRGSTPQKPGAVMLVFPDGSQCGTLGGGCVEAEVKRRALQLLDAGNREILTFKLDDNYGWDDGLICGGRMKMVVDPVRPGEDNGYFQTLARISQQGAPATEAIVIDPEKVAISGGEEISKLSDPLLGGDRFLLDQTGNLVAQRTSKPVSLPEVIVQQLRPVVSRPRPYVEGGISYLPWLERCRLIVVGAGHVGQKVAELASECDFEVWVIDDRHEYCNPDRFPRAKRLIVSNFDSALSGLEIDPNTYCLIVTRGHQHDEEALYHLAETSARYVGMIGSRRKIKLIFDDLLADGISREALLKVHAPLGLNIGSQTVPEIAISILSELIAHRNTGSSPELLRERSVLLDPERTGENLPSGPGTPPLKL